MKKWSRLTALVLAFAIVLSTVSGALAQIEIDHDDFQTWVADTKEAEGLSGVISIDQGGEVLVEPSTFTGELNQGPLYTSETSKNLNTYAQGSAPTVDVQLGQYGKVDLVAPSAGKWQVYLSAADLWVNITGETGSTFALTYAKVKGMIDADGAAKIRCLMGESVTETVNVHVSYEASAIVVNAAPAVSQPMVMSARTVAAGTTKAGEDTTTYTVSIVYLFEDETSAASSYVAQVGKGTSYDKVVPNPVVVGYDAYVNNVKADSVTLDYSDIQENKEVFVYYKPANVGFTVIHYQQNVGNDEYTEFARETKDGFTKEEVGSGLEKNYNGFQALLYDTTVKIAADGTTYVEIYYDRNYYLVNFVLNGGYGVEPIYARYGAPISIEEPTRLGYTFNGWSPAVPPTVPYGGGEYTAQWTAGGAKYTVIYWAENANNNNYSYWGNAEKTAKAGDLVSGTDDFNGTTDLPKAGFHFSHADQNKVVEGDGSTIVNVYYKRNTYTLIFAYEGGDFICGGTHNHNNCTLICSLTEHVHDMSCWYGYNCDRDEHEHSYSCYDCGKVAHTSHSVENGCYGMKFENIKYGADTSSYWAQAPAYKWLVSYNRSTFYTAAPAMPNSNLIIYGTSQSGSSVIHYYEKVNGQETTNKVRPDYTVNTDGWSFTSEDYIDIPGFTYSSSRNNNAGTQYYIYYTRNSYNLTFQNGSETTSGGTHLYEADISDTYFVPEYTGDEAEAYEFGGWYTTEGCLKGTEFEFKGATMPYNHLILYAKWVPVTHTVDVYLTDAKTEQEQLSTEEVSHRAFASEPEEPTNGNYTFAGWFYMDNGEEKAFSFASMPIIQDMEIYAKWSSNKLMEYVIHYELEDGTPIAPDTTGSALAGSTKTFEAKIGDALNAGYQAGYYPKVSSHSITIDIDDASKNEFTFVYVQMPKVPYTVRYLEEGTNKVLYTEKNTETNMAVVTENFVVVTGYRPDAYQKRLVLSADTAQNVITFWYVVDEEHAPVMITHYTQNIVGDGYSEYQSSTDLNAVIGNPYSEDYLTIPGFVQNTTVEGTLTSGTLTAEGLHLKLYYDRIEYPYEFNFLLYDTTTKLAGSETGNARYGATVNQTAKSIDGYKLVSDSAQSIVIAIEDPANVADKNVKNFFYVEDDIPLHYVAVGPTGSGTIVPAEETVKAVTGKANGSTATAAANYVFEGWYKDADCSQPVDKAWVDENNKILPVKEGDIWTETTYYAKFVEQKVTINYVVVGPDGSGSVTPGTETINMVTGTADGSTATATENYKFVGWFSDADCKTAVDSTWVDEKNHLTPVKAEGTVWPETSTYYAKFVELPAVINYEVVGPDGSGTVTLDTETINMVTGTAAGSTATAAKNYKFVGWFSDADCKTAVDSTWVDEKNHLTPVKAEGTVWPATSTYYAKFEELPAVINYEVVGPDGSGTVTLDTETINMVTGTAAGSTATATENYKFVGWFSDADCETVVDPAWVNENNHLTPVKAEGTVWPETSTYYAKFELDVSTLTISKTVDTLNENTDNPANAADKVFEFNISNLEKGKEYTYSIRNVDGKKTFTTNTNGVGTITLAAGQTAVIEGIVIGTAVVVSETEYEYYNTTSIPANGTVTIDADGETVAFTNTYTKYKTGSLTLTKQFQDASFTEETKSVTLLLKLKSDLNNPLDPELEKQFEEWARTAGNANGWNANANEASILITVAASAENKTNSVTLNNLPVADYVVTEKTDVMPEYNVVYQPEDGCATVTAASTSVPEVKVTNTITGKRDIVVNKIWEDLDNKYGVRPEMIQLTLLANGEAATSKAQGFVNPAQVTGTENQWQVTFAGLDTFDTQGNFIVYTVHELAVPEYAVTNTESIVDLTTNELTITNTLQRADLTISKTGLNAFVYKSGGDHESALFKVEATDKTKDDREWTVAINGNSSVTIKGVKIGVQYKVTELNDWTWRYDENASTSKTTEPITEAGASVEFANELDKTQWLNGDNYKVNVFGPSND